MLEKEKSSCSVIMTGKISCRLRSKIKSYCPTLRRSQLFIKEQKKIYTIKILIDHKRLRLFKKCVSGLRFRIACLEKLFIICFSLPSLLFLHVFILASWRDRSFSGAQPSSLSLVLQNQPWIKFPSYLLWCLNGVDVTGAW